MANNDGFKLSRRKILAGLGSIGVASAGVGLGTSAYFSDEENFANNQLVAGSLDMKVSWEEHYSDWLGDEQDVDGVRMVDGTEDLESDEVGLPSYDDPLIAVPEGQLDAFMDATLQEQFPDDETRDQIGELPPEVDPCEALADVPGDLTKPVIDLEDVKPGDFGEVTFDFTICDNPGYVWLTGGLVDAVENGLTEPERKDEDELEGVVELLDEIEVTVWYDSGDNVLSETESYVTDRSVTDTGPISSAVALTGDQRIIAQGSLREVLGRLSIPPGIPLDGFPNDEERDCFTPTPTIHYVGVAWSLPVDHANEIQTDSVTFDLGFYTEQCRHNDGVGLSTGLSGYYPLDTVGDGTAEDYSGTGNDGTVRNGVSSVSGKIGRAASFDGSDDYIEVPDDTSLDITGPYTETAWVNMTSVGGRNDITMKDPGQWALGFQVRNGTLRAGFEDESDNNYIGVGGTVSTRSWTHLGVVYTGTRLKGFVNGSKVFDRTTASDASGISIGAATPATNDDPLTIGRGEGQFSGTIDDLRIYDRALGEDEIQQLANQ